MKHSLLFVMILLSCYLGVKAQKLTFTGTYTNHHVDLEAIIIKNLMRDCDTILVWPDTILDLDALGIADKYISSKLFEVYQNIPNPTSGKTMIQVNIPFNSDSHVMLYDLTGRKVHSIDTKLSKGSNYFELAPGKYRSLLFSVIVGNEMRTIKILSFGNSNQFNLAYKGSNQHVELKSLSDNGFIFVANDMLEFTGLYNDQTLKLYDIPVGNETYTFNFNVEEVVAAFSYAIDPQNSMTVNFTNLSLHADTYQWNFGDGFTSTEKNPVHAYSAEGNYTVKLIATNSAGSDQIIQVLNIENTQNDVLILTGGSEKTWKLIRDVSTGVYPLQVGPQDESTVWWAFGLYENLSVRPCMLNDEWKFTVSGEMHFDDKGDYWAEGSIYPDDMDDMCAFSDNPMVNHEGTDVSAWSSGVHQWSINSPGYLTVTGNGAYIGLCKAGNNEEVIVPQEYVTYQILKLTDGPTDTLIVQANYLTGGDVPIPAYWRFALVHYDNPADEPPIPSDPPVADFEFEVFISNPLMVNFLSYSMYGEDYLWDFGDGSTSIEEHNLHTYAYPGSYNVTLTVTNYCGSDSITRVVNVE